MLAGRSWRAALELTIGVMIAAVVLHTWFVLGWIVPVTVSGSSMAPTLLGPHRFYACPDCRYAFAVGLDQLPPDELGFCSECQRQAARPSGPGRRGERLSIARTAFAWREPHRWDLIVFRCPQRGNELCVKRVVGRPGENVGLAEGDVLINGRVIRKTLAEQRRVRKRVDRGDAEEAVLRLGELQLTVPPVWRVTGRASSPDRRAESPSPMLEYGRSGPILDVLDYNQGAVPPPNVVNDLMLTFAESLEDTGRLKIVAENRRGRFEFAVDFANGFANLTVDGKKITERPIPPMARNGQVAEWTISLFDRQALLAIGDHVVLAEPWDVSGEQNPSRRRRTIDRAPFALEVSGLSGAIYGVKVWRDVYLGIRHGDGRQSGAERGRTTTWQLGPSEFFVVGDNASISDDSRSWHPRAGVDAKLLIGKPLGVR
jgi:signal peptidase I